MADPVQPYIKVQKTSSTLIQKSRKGGCRETVLILKTFIRVFQKHFVVNERSAVKNSFSTHVWSKVDSF